MKYGEFNGVDYELNVSLSPELEAIEKIGFLIFKDAYTVMTKGKWEGIVKAEQDAIDAANAAAATNTGGGGGGYSGGGDGGGGGGGTGGGFGGGGGGWYIWNPTVYKTSISIGEPLEGTGIVSEQKKAEQ
jgi:hypothetical protein